MSSRRTYSSSAPKYETRRPGRVYASPPPESYHGPHFDRAMAQEQYWDSIGSREVWDPSKQLSSVAARPETYGLAHSYHESRLEHEYSDPYEKRPSPYTRRAEADYKTYKRPSDGHGEIAEQVRKYKDTPVGRNISPHDFHRDSLLEGKRLAREGRDMSNLAAQSRLGFNQKYPQGYEDLTATENHMKQVRSQIEAARGFRKADNFIDGRLDAFEKQMVRRGRR
ncbi:hypothetical protein PISL3812_08842 [Talaromyces islandicus]|uniref:Uncharacterized protein n=1 Tax=Talaromyces islandicus TaxID=28573 RepID=A0A0U1MA06_TALIS|nr:hypothetical protein PISL3812_08842 [Talaromyces islandicus]